MSITTLFQDAARKNAAYGVVADSVWEDILYIPYNDVATKRISLLTSLLGYNNPGDNTERCPMDFIVDGVVGSAYPRPTQITAADAVTMTEQVHSFGTAKSFALVHVATSFAIPAHVEVTMGTAAAATSKVQLAPGVAVVDWTNAAQDDASSATSLSSAGSFAVALVVDRIANTLSIYEADLDEGNDFSLLNSIATTNGTGVAFNLDDPTAITINNSFSLNTFGTLLIAADGTVPLPSDLIANLSTTVKNWYAGTFGITI